MYKRQTLAMPVADPRTGEIIAEAGENLTRERARELEDRGVNEAVDVYKRQLLRCPEEGMCLGPTPCAAWRQNLRHRPAWGAVRPE